MAAAKKKPKIQASDVSRKLESVLLDLAEQAKANNERFARVDDRSARVDDRSARAEELAAIALQEIAAVTKDLRALAQRTDDRPNALESPAAAE